MSSRRLSCVSEEQRALAVDEPEEALHAGQLLRVLQRAQRQVRRPNWFRHQPSIAVGTEDQHAGGDRAVLVARQRRDAQHLDGRRDPIGARDAGADRVRVAVGEDAGVAILDGAAEELAALEHRLRVEDRVVARRQHRANRARHPDLVRRERPPLGHAQAVARAEPPHVHDVRVVGRLDGEPAVGDWPTASGRPRTSPARRTAAALPAGSCRTSRPRRARAAG